MSKTKKCKVCSKIIKNGKRTISCSSECRVKWLAKKTRNRYRKKGKRRRLKLRFEIFQRDNFKCIYCGRYPPKCILEIDHKRPKSRKGENNSYNYVTYCKECNIRKGDMILNEFKNI